jgi:hypothetical protein
MAMGVDEYAGPAQIATAGSQMTMPPIRHPLLTPACGTNSSPALF